MGITLKEWKHMVSTRSDMSSYVTHLTRDSNTRSTLENLIKILEDKKLIGSSTEGYIQGNDKAVCFQDAPLSGIVQNVYHNQMQVEEGKTSKYRYRACGLMFLKPYVFIKGARPVIYETKKEAREKFPDELWRVVTLDMNKENDFVDWTHEREWRVKGDFEFDLKEVVILVPNHKAYKYLISKLDEETLKEIRGIIQMDPINF